jgi:hypothetical protein
LRFSSGECVWYRVCLIQLTCAQTVDECISEVCKLARHGFMDTPLRRTFVLARSPQDDRSYRMDETYVWDVCRATTRLPATHFPAGNVEGDAVDEGSKLNYINPTKTAYMEALNIWPEARHFDILSLGCGKSSKSIGEVEGVKRENEDRQGPIGKVLGKLLSVFRYDRGRKIMEQWFYVLRCSQAERVHGVMEGMQDRRLRYDRLNVGSPLEDAKFNDWKGVEAMKELTDDYLKGDGREIFNRWRQMFQDCN